ncbi:MAG TPA: type I-C CRISPR-associated protein Cas8c/Csd1 [Pseudomonadales bacterium]|nr:type I-C CRISPR-associated protein Cas8c/Csd1 [Pseudomonadales bacterium]HMW15749.1 type I-C CRISPR-associated protein Cas8c/Csd1 [Pseudomonadales bacterium]HMW84042.1 type I-C CRISPR-associated protein Cas8c/Csd1 [Pseudomonadales bacterium]HMZ70119.1 type I-C CRISPR-associated protein Cas8c/Csd1 [Pseudomonadales bacterium]HNB82934.1 type I-C CRISPR-associated protein Cas8c/Csd1 [Pseudomonadales bacterium]
MILHALADYYRRKQADPDPAQRLPAYGFEEKEIPFILEIDSEGRLVQILDTRSGEGKKKTAQRFLVPKAVKKTSGVAANLLWDTAEYVLGIDTRGKPERVAEQHAAFRARIDALPDAVKADPGVAAVLKFLDRIDFDVLAACPAWEEIKTTNPLLSFRLHGDAELICQRPAVTVLAGDEPEDEATVICLVSGEQAAPERLHAAIKGVWGAQSSGANIVSFNLDAFNSYGKAQGANAPVGKAAAFAYTTALNHLLAKGSSQRLQVGDASTVFWAEAPHELETALPDLFGESPKDDPDRGADALRALYRAVETGRFAVGSDDTRFYVLGLAPNAARIAVRFWETAPAIELARRIKRHFDDIAVARSPRDPEHLSLFRLLTATAVQGKADNIPPNLGGEVMRAIVEGLPYPATLLNAAVQRCRAEQQVSYPRAAAIKGWLNRDARRRHLPQEEFSPMLDPDHPSAAYRLGRLFATLEKIQEEASPGLNATIRDRYYGAASATPVAVFTTLLRLKNHHLGKLNPGRATQMEKLIGEIMAGIEDFPRHLNLPDQGRFALGYYHQRQSFFTKRAAEATETESTQGEPA